MGILSSGGPRCPRTSQAPRTGQRPSARRHLNDARRRARLIRRFDVRKTRSSDRARAETKRRPPARSLILTSESPRKSCGSPPSRSKKSVDLASATSAACSTFRSSASLRSSATNRRPPKRERSVRRPSEGTQSPSDAGRGLLPTPIAECLVRSIEPPPTHERESTRPLPSHPHRSITAAIRAERSISHGMSYQLPASSEAYKEPEQLGRRYRKRSQPSGRSRPAGSTQ